MRQYRIGSGANRGRLAKKITQPKLRKLQLDFVPSMSSALAWTHEWLQLRSALWILSDSNRDLTTSMYELQDYAQLVLHLYLLFTCKFWHRYSRERARIRIPDVIGCQLYLYPSSSAQRTLAGAAGSSTGAGSRKESTLAASPPRPTVFLTSS